MRWMSFAVRAAMVVSALCGSAGAQCPISVRALLDDYPGTVGNAGIYGPSSAIVRLPGAGGTRDALLLGGVQQPLSPVGQHLFTWDGRRSVRFDAPPLPSSLFGPGSLQVDPQTSRLHLATLNNLGEFDGTAWSATVSRPVDMIKQLFAWNGHLYLAGAPTNMGPATVFRRDGEVWTALPPFWSFSNGLHYDAVYGMCEHQGALVVCAESGVYSWNGSAWSVAATVPSGTRPYAVASFEGTLWAALTTSGTGSMTVRRRVGTQWQTVPTPPGLVTINDFNVLNGRLYASGNFNGAALMEWTGSGWRAAGTGVSGQVRSLGSWGGEAAVLGGFRDVSARQTLTFSGGSWQGLPSLSTGAGTLDGRQFVTLGGRRAVSGFFWTPSGIHTTTILWQDGAQWRPLAHPLPIAPSTVCEWNGEIAAVTGDPADAKSSLVYSLAAVDGEWTFRGRFRGGAPSVLMSRNGRLVAAGTFESVSDGATTIPACGVAELGPEGWVALGDPRAEYIRDAVSKDGAVFLLAMVKASAGASARTHRVLQWSEEARRWDRVGPDLSLDALQLFLVGSQPCVAFNFSWGTSPYSHAKGEVFLLRDGEWQDTGLPAGQVEQIDDRTLAVANASSLRTSVQLYRFTLSADIAGGQDGAGDGVIDGADVARFAEWMSAGDLRADLGSLTGTVGDDVLDVNDWNVFWQMYDGGCR